MEVIAIITRYFVRICVLVLVFTFLMPCVTFAEEGSIDANKAVYGEDFSGEEGLSREQSPEETPEQASEQFPEQAGDIEVEGPEGEAPEIEKEPQNKMQLILNNAVLPLEIKDDAGNIMVPVREVFSAIGFQVSWDAASMTITITKPGITLKAILDSRIVFVNEIPYAASSAIKKIGGAACIPLDVLSEAVGMNISVDTKVNKISMTGQNNLIRQSNIEELFPSSPVTCIVKKGARLYDSINGKSVKIFNAQASAEVLKDKSYLWYQVKTADNSTGWIKAGDLIIDEAYEVKKDTLRKEEIEAFINYKKLESATEFLVWVDISRQVTHALNKSEDGSWELFRSMSCATGKNNSPTTRGVFKIAEDRGKWFYSQVFQSGAANWVRFNGPYLFHSIALDKKGNVKDPTLRDRVSSGCIRLSMEDSQWIYQMMKSGTTVFVN